MAILEVSFLSMKLVSLLRLLTFIALPFLATSTILFLCRTKKGCRPLTQPSCLVAIVSALFQHTISLIAACLPILRRVAGLGKLNCQSSKYWFIYFSLWISVPVGYLVLPTGAENTQVHLNPSSNVLTLDKYLSIPAGRFP